MVQREPTGLCRPEVSWRCAAGTPPAGRRASNASEHVCHPYTAMMYLVGDECSQTEFFGKKVEDAPAGLFLVNEAALNQYDENGDIDMARSLMKASEAFVEFIDQTPGYTFDCNAGIFYEEHIFSKRWYKAAAFRWFSHVGAGHQSLGTASAAGCRAGRWRNAEEKVTVVTFPLYTSSRGWQPGHWYVRAALRHIPCMEPPQSPFALCNYRCRVIFRVPN